MIFLPPQVQFDFASTINWGQYIAKLEKCKRISVGRWLDRIDSLMGSGHLPGVKMAKQFEANRKLQSLKKTSLKKVLAF